MKTELALTNESFNFLESSGDFLNIVLNNINTCVLLLDRNLRLKAFNDALKTIFSNKKDEDLLYVKCGEAIGCAHQIEEKKECGNTSKCIDCDLRVAALTSYLTGQTIFKNLITRPFFNSSNQKVNKHLQFSTRIFEFEEEKYIIMLIEDITKFIELKTKYVETN